MEWVYRYMVGIDTCADAPGYRRFMIQPHPGGGLSHAAATIDTVRGRITCKWYMIDGRFILCVSVPPNTAAEIRLPVFVSSIADAGGLDFVKINEVLCASVHAGEYRIVCS